MRQLRNVLANWGSFALSAAVGFFLSPIVVRHLGNSLYGLWALIGSLVGYLGLLDLGVRGAVTRFIARHHATDDVPAASRLASSALAFFSVLSGIAVLITATVVWLLPHIVRTEGTYIPAARMAVAICGITVGVSLIGGVFGGIIAGLQRFSTLSGLDASIELFRALCTLTVLKLGGGLVALALVQFGCATIRTVAYVVLARRLYPTLRIHSSLVNRSAIRDIVGFSLAATMLNASGMLILYSDSLVIGTMIAVSSVTFFAIAANLTDYARALVSGLSSTLTPLASATEAVDGRGQVRALLLRALRLSLAVLLPVLVTLEIRGPTFIGLWMGPQYIEISGTVLRLLVGILIFATSHQVLTVIMMGLNLHRQLVPVFVLEALSNLALSIALVRPFGLIGVALGTVIPRLIVTLVVCPWIASRSLGVAPLVYAREAWIKPLLSAIPFAAVTWAIEALWPVSNLLLFFTQVLLALPFAAGAIWLILTPSERDGLASALRLPMLVPSTKSTP